jgi:hypothetical protein
MNVARGSVSQRSLTGSGETVRKIRASSDRSSVYVFDQVETPTWVSSLWSFVSRSKAKGVNSAPSPAARNDEVAVVEVEIEIVGSFPSVRPSLSSQYEGCSSYLDLSVEHGGKAKHDKLR